MKKLLFGLLLSAFIVVPAASAGGWATVRMSSVPTDLAAGEPWNLTIRVLQHGNPDTPVEGAKPRVTLENVETGARIVYTGQPVQDPGSYRFEMVFPEAGRWMYSIYDGFEEFGGAETHTYAPVTIGSPRLLAPVEPGTHPTSTDRSVEVRTSGGMQLWLVALGGGVLLSGLAVGGLLVRRRVSAHAH